MTSCPPPGIDHKQHYTAAATITTTRHQLNKLQRTVNADQSPGAFPVCELFHFSVHILVTSHTLSPTMSRSTLPRRKSSYHYQTFPTSVSPPASRGRPPTHDHSKDDPRSPIRSSASSFLSARDANGPGGCSNPTDHNTPVPKRQLIILAIISLAEQTALNSISPYLPEMAATFPEVDITR